MSFRIEIGTNLDTDLQSKLDELYCDQCKKSGSGGPGCCVGCYFIADIRIVKEPNKFEEEE